MPILSSYAPGYTTALQTRWPDFEPDEEWGRKLTEDVRRTIRYKKQEIVDNQKAQLMEGAISKEQSDVEYKQALRDIKAFIEEYTLALRQERDLFIADLQEGGVIHKEQQINLVTLGSREVEKKIVHRMCRDLMQARFPKPAEEINRTRAKTQDRGPVIGSESWVRWRMEFNNEQREKYRLATQEEIDVEALKRPALYNPLASNANRPTASLSASPNISTSASPRTLFSMPSPYTGPLYPDRNGDISNSARSTGTKLSPLSRFNSMHIRPASMSSGTPRTLARSGYSGFSESERTRPQADSHDDQQENVGAEIQLLKKLPSGEEVTPAWQNRHAKVKHQRPPRSNNGDTLQEKLRVSRHHPPVSPTNASYPLPASMPMPRILQVPIVPENPLSRCVLLKIIDTFEYLRFLYRKLKERLIHPSSGEYLATKWWIMHPIVQM
jgi:hypothetical protein